MSENMPLDIQAEIMKRLPIKSLIQFRSVSKPWKSLIDNSTFISDYHLRNAQPQHLLLGYYEDSERKYVSIVDDDTFPQHKVPLNLPLSIERLEPTFIGSSQGLLCFCSYDETTAVIWNPVIRKSVVIPADNDNVVGCSHQTRVIGFGVCPHTCDPKLVKITDNWCPKSCPKSKTATSWQVEVFTLSSGVWRTTSSNLSGHFELLSRQQDTNGFIYWFVIVKGCDMILSFDITSEKLTEVNLPESLANGNCYGTSKLSGSLDVLETVKFDEGCSVWMMEHGVPNSFAKLFTVRAHDASLGCGFRKSGEAILEIFAEELSSQLYAYEPYSECINYIGVPGEMGLFVSSYMETLLLLDH